MRRPALLVLLTSMLLAGCGGSGSPHPRSPSASVSGDDVPVPTLPALPDGLAGDDPCGTASSALVAAQIYVGLAQLGRTDEAQRCVRGVSRSTTAELTVPGTAELFVPLPTSTATVIRFRQAVGARTVSVTVATRDARYVVTAVRG